MRRGHLWLRRLAFTPAGCKPATVFIERLGTRREYDAIPALSENRASYAPAESDCSRPNGSLILLVLKANP